MLRHYTKATAAERAVLAHKRVSPSDRLRVRWWVQPSAFRYCTQARISTLAESLGRAIEWFCGLLSDICQFIAHFRATIVQDNAHCYRGCCRIAQLRATSLQGKAH